MGLLKYLIITCTMRDAFVASATNHTAAMFVLELAGTQAAGRVHVAFASIWVSNCELVTWLLLSINSVLATRVGLFPWSYILASR